MSQQLNELEQRIGYNFHNREYLRRALTCQSAINERHPDATNQNFQALEFIGDAALKYAVATLLYADQNVQWSAGQLHDKVAPFISNVNLTRIGNELHLSEHIIKGRGVTNLSNNMLADGVEAILGAIVIDQQQQGKAAENVLFDVVARLWSIKLKGKLMTTPPVPHDDNTKSCCCACACCKWFGIFLLILVLVGITAAILYYVKSADL